MTYVFGGTLSLNQSISTHMVGDLHPRFETTLIELIGLSAFGYFLLISCVSVTFYR